jgi:hypothetical protein
MRAFVWGGLTLCALGLPVALGSVAAAPRLAQQPIASQRLPNGPTLERSGAGALLARTPDHEFDAGAPGASISSAVHGCSDASPCTAMRETADVSLGQRLALAAREAEAPANYSHSGAMTALDLVLMVLFAVGLIGYQLDRKQRVLRHSALFAAPP